MQALTINKLVKSTIKCNLRPSWDSEPESFDYKSTALTAELRVLELFGIGAEYYTIQI